MTDFVPTAQYPASIDDWKLFYLKLKLPDTLPEVEEDIIIGTTIYKRSLLVDLSTIDKERKLYHSVYVFSDVAVLAPNNLIDLSRGGFLFIVARFLSAGGDCQLDVKIGNSRTAVFLYVEILQQNLTIRFTDDSGIVGKHYLDKGTSPVALKVSCTKKNIQTTEIPKFSDIPLQKDLTKRFLMTQLRIASLTRLSNYRFSVSILRFIHRLTSKSTSATAFFEASLMLKQLNHRHGGGESVRTVPTVSIQVLERNLRSLLTTASLFDTEFSSFFNSHGTDARRSADQLVLNMKVSVEDQDRRFHIAEEEWRAAQAALQIVQKKAEVMRQAVDELSVEFARSVKEWAREAKNKLIVKSIFTFIGLAVSLASVLAGNPVALAHSPELIEALTDIADGMEKINEVASQLSELGNTVQKAFSHLNETMEDAHSNILILDSPEKNPMEPSKQNCDPDGINAVAAWDMWVLGIHPQMESAIQNGILNAQKYLTALEKQATLGKAICQATAAVTKAAQKYERISLSFCSVKARYDEYLEESMRAQEDDKVAFDNTSVLFFDRLLSIKIDIVSELESYKRSYKYYSLRDSAVKIDVNKSVTELNNDFTAIMQERKNYLDGRSSGPQPFYRRGTLSDYPVDHEVVIRDLQSAEHRFTLTLDNNPRGPFHGLWRVRVSSLRLRLVGAHALKPHARTSVKLQIETNGIYKDLDGNSVLFTFSTTPLSLGFHYDVDNPEVVQLDVDISDQDHALPTPFTDWTVSITNPADLDLSDLKDVDFQWHGTALPIRQL